MSGSHDETLKLWNLEINHAIRTYEGLTLYVLCVTKLTDTMFVSGSSDKTLKLWNVEIDDAIRTFHRHIFPFDVVCVAKLIDTAFVSGSGSEDRTLKLWNIENNDSVRTFQGHTNGVNDSVRTFQGHTNGVQCVAKLTDTTFVSGSKDNTLKLWNIVNNHAIRTYEGHTLRIVVSRN